MVVLPVPVPPETITFRWPCTQAFRNSISSGVAAPRATRSAAVSGFLKNLRMVSVGPFRQSGGMIALRREPSGRRASIIGVLSSQRRPSGEMIRSLGRSP